MRLLPSLQQNPFYFIALYRVYLVFISLLGPFSALAVRHQCILASAVLKYECTPIFVVSLPFWSL